jgi:FkbM family methyltransferase
MSHNSAKKNSIHKYRQRFERLGFAGFVKYMWHLKTRLPKQGLFRLTARKSAHPLQCRGGTTDIDVFKHIYVCGEYDCLDALENPELIVDCGANAGFSASYFLSRFPSAAVVAVEPDPGNYRMLVANTALFGGRCKTYLGGIWAKSCGLVLCDSVHGDGREWARGVREAGPGEVPEVKAFGIRELLDLSGKRRISLLKVDIEGSELELFSGDCSDWLPLVDNIIIEIHGSECARVYHEAVARHGFVSSQVGGLVWSRPSSR